MTVILVSRFSYRLNTIFFKNITYIRFSKDFRINPGYVHGTIREK